MYKKNLYVSNLAWHKKDYLKIFKLLINYKIKGIDLAPINIHGTWSQSEKKAPKFKKILDRYNLKVNAIQGIFFNTNFNLFKTNKKKLLDHFKRIINITKKYNCNKIILGSVNFKNKGLLKKNEANLKFLYFFNKIEKILKKK